MKCTCGSWKENIEHITRPLLIEQVRNPKFKPKILPFEFCPWCSEVLQEEEEKDFVDEEDVRLDAQYVRDRLNKQRGM